MPRAARSTGCVEVQRRGAGEIVLNCMASDGVRRGYDIEQLRAVRDVCRVPLVASGGAGSARALSRRCFARPASMRRWPPACFTPARSRFRDLKRQLRARRHRGESMIGTRRQLDWDKSGGLLPAIVQDADSGAVLMLAT